MIWGSGGSKSRLAKAAGAEPAGQTRDEKLHAVVARSTFRSENVQNTHHSRTTLGSWDVEKVHAVVRRSTFPSQNEQNTSSRTTFGSSDLEKVFAVVARSTFPSQNVPFSDHFWKLRCRKSARRCGAKHISKSKCTKHLSVGPLLEVRILKKCTPLWCEAHFELKMLKALGIRVHFWKFRSRKSARRCGAKYISKSKCTKHTIIEPLLEVQILKKWTSLWREAHSEVKMLKTLRVWTTFGGSDVASLHYTTLHYITLHYTSLHYTTGHYTTLHSSTLHYTPVHSTTLNCTTPHYITLHYAPLHYTTLHHITLHYITLNDTAPQIDR